MNISDEIEKQLNEGFSAEEMRTNLLNLGFSDAEIQQNLKPTTANAIQSTEEPKAWTIIVPIFAIIRGLMYFSKGLPTFGFIVTGAGVIGIIAYAARR